jgi:uncharacterized membrane protein YhaH (DUF805 family)
MALKYALDAAAVWLVTRQLWSPVDYLVPSITLRESKLTGASTWLVVAMIVWTLPFLWIGASMTLRRALDAGRSPWLATLFFVPLVNYALMLVLAVLPSRAHPVPARDAEVTPASLQTVAFAVLVSGLMGTVLVAFCTVVLQAYGATLFLGVPFLVGAISGFALNRAEPSPLGATVRVAAGTVVVGGLGLLLFALEGALCVTMALPVAVPLAIAGALVGRFIARHAPTTTLHAVVVVLAIPGLAAVETTAPPPAVHEVTSSLEIAAAPAVVWRHVAAFGEIPDTPAWFFRLGVAYPVRAFIDGHGVGAVRRCEFSTGAFVEPITVWDAPRRLAFDVSAQPPALHELSPYRAIQPSHLGGAFRARRGEFRLIALPDGRTRLEGSTWYTLAMAPAPYWRPWADALVHAIHLRVLAHVGRLAERD